MAKSRKRDMKLRDYNISKAKYNELKYFCMQYGEKKCELQKGYGLKAIVNEGMPKGNLHGNPTTEEAVKRVMLQRDIELIEQTAIEADPEIYRWLLKNVTEGIAYEYMDVPKCRADFYGARKYYFFLLAQKR